jgi:hypothetical protein
MQIALRVLIILQTIGIEIATLAAMGSVETVEAAGPILSCMGAAIVYLAFRQDLPRGMCFGLAAPTVYVCCFALVCGMQWNPEAARSPLLLILTAVVVGHVVVGFYALEELSAIQGLDRPKLPLQFSIRAFLILMFLVALLLGSYQGFGPVGTAIIALIVYGSIVAYLLWQYRAMRTQAKEEEAKEPPILLDVVTPKDEELC